MMWTFTTLHCCNIVYLQEGGGSFRKQKDVIVTPCIAALLYIAAIIIMVKERFS